MNRQLIIFFFILTFISKGVNGQQIYSEETYLKKQTELKCIRSKHKFKFSKRRFQKRIDFSKIDTNAVYIYDYPKTNIDIDQLVKSDSAFCFYRFFKTAVFESGPYASLPDTVEFENLKYGVWRCYTMTKKGLVIIEEPKRFEMDSRWIFYYGSIFEDKIVLTHYHFSYPPFATSPGYLQPFLTCKKHKTTFGNKTYIWK